HWDQLVHAEDWLLFEKNIGAYICIDEVALSRGELYTVLKCKFKDIALTRLARWYDEVDKSGFLTFERVARSIQTHYLDIINFFERRATNAAAESFNAKIKAFRAQFRGVRDRAFFLYRLVNYMLKYKIPQIVTLTTHFVFSGTA
ncbi:transposase, partial [Bacteroides stercoris]|uniref:transposase n=1 Tax=Bacteroides stercoris TaxID=46506 RepID=UPI000B214231